MPTKQVKIAIVMTVQNEELYLRECLQSIINQSFKDWELVVIDDHSSDSTSEILEDFKQKDKRIQWHTNDGNGIIPALTLAYEKSTAPYITRMDGDDLMPADKLELLLNIIKHHGKHVIATGKVQYFSSHPITAGYKRYENWLNDRCEKNDHAAWIYRECIVASPNWLCHRSVIDAVGGFANLQYPEDYDLVLKWIEKGFAIQSTTAITHLWREHPERTSRNSSVYDQASFFHLKLTFFAKKYHDSPIFVLGEGKKANLALEILKKLNCFTEQLIAQSQDKRSINLDSLNRKGAIVLIAIYPKDETRAFIEKELQKKGFHLGENLYYL